MKKETILVGIVALVAGLIIGWMVWQKSSSSPPTVAPAPVPGFSVQLLHAVPA